MSKNYTSCLFLDLGTSNSCIFVEKDGILENVPDVTGSNTFPSFVSLLSDDQYAGFSAKSSIQTNKWIACNMKRIIGRKFADEITQKYYMDCNCMVVEDSNGTASFMNEKGDIISCEETCAILIRMLKRIAEDYLRSQITYCVITVPAYFDQNQKLATRRAVELAGLDVVGMLNEPTAAALSCRKWMKQKSMTILVYDFGGGTFDVSIVRMENNICEVLGTGGKNDLGGRDIDSVLSYSLQAAYHSVTHKNIIRCDDKGVPNRRQTMLLLELVEGVKKQLSFQDVVEYDFCGIRKGVTEDRFMITREVFEELIHEIIQESISIVGSVLKDNHLIINDIDTVVLVGGTSRIPLVQKRIEELFGASKISKIANPDMCVAEGAGIYYQNRKIRLKERLSIGIGIKVDGGKISHILRRNDVLPIQKERKYKVTNSDFGCIKTYIYTGNSKYAEECTLIESVFFTIEEDVKEIRFKFSVNLCGILSVECIDVKSGKGLYKTTYERNVV